MRAQKFGIEIAGAGRYLPERTMTNQELLALFPRLQMSAEQIYNLLGVQERRVAEPHMTCAEMLARAGTQAINAAGISAGEIDLIIACPVPPDAVTPPTAALVQHYLGGSPTCTGFDLNMACTGSIAAIDIACRFLESGAYRNVLIVAGTIMSRDNTVWTNPMHRFIFGDGAGAVVLRRSTHGQQLTLKHQVAAEDENPEVIFYPLPWSIRPRRSGTDWSGYFMGERDYFFDKMLTVGRKFVEAFWVDTGLRPDQFTHAVIHQPSKDLFLKSVEVAGIPISKVSQNFALIGNVIAAELFIALHDLLPRLKAGDRLYGWIYGSGFTLGALAYELPNTSSP